MGATLPPTPTVRDGYTALAYLKPAHRKTANPRAYIVIHGLPDKNFPDLLDSFEDSQNVLQEGKYGSNRKALVPWPSAPLPSFCGHI